MKKTGFRRGEALRRAGWAGGACPSAQIQGADSGFRRTACLHPRLRVIVGLRFAVRSLSKAIDRENNKVRRLCWHLIHRKRSPFPSIGEGLSAVEIEASIRMAGAFFDAPRRGAGLPVTSSTAERSPFPSRGRT